MKKIILSLVLTVFAITADAQLYLGGRLGVGADISGRGNWVDFLQCSIQAEIGKKMNSKIALGTTLGYEYLPYDGTHSFIISPYIRYTFVHWDMVSLFTDIGGSYAHLFGYQRGAYAVTIGLSPGVILNLSQHFSLIAHFGLLGCQWNNADPSFTETSFGLQLNGSSLTFGAYYNF